MAAATRRRELSEGLARLIDKARESSARAVIIAGDLFDRALVSARVREGVLTAISAATDLDFYYLGGNHEGQALTRGVGELPKNLFIFGEEWTYFNTGSVVIAGRAATCDGMFDTLSLPRDTKNIVVLHGEIRAASEERGVIGIKEAAGRGIDYLALGHYHKYSSFPIDERGVAVYSGTPEGRGFDECGDCGAVIIDTESPPPYHTFIKTARRALHSVEIDISSAHTEADIKRTLLEKLAAIPSSDLVRASLVGRVGADLWRDTEAIRESTMDRFFHAELCDATRIRISPEDYELDSSLRGELVRSVMADETLTDLQKEKIIACSLAALEGEAYFGV